MVKLRAARCCERTCLAQLEEDWSASMAIDPITADIGACSLSVGTSLKPTASRRGRSTVPVDDEQVPPFCGVRAALLSAAAAVSRQTRQHCPSARHCNQNEPNGITVRTASLRCVSRIVPPLSVWQIRTKSWCEKFC